MTQVQIAINSVIHHTFNTDASDILAEIERKAVLIAGSKVQVVDYFFQVEDTFILNTMILIGRSDV